MTVQGMIAVLADISFLQLALYAEYVTRNAGLGEAQAGMQHVRPPCPSPTPGVYQNPCPLSQ